MAKRKCLILRGAEQGLFHYVIGERSGLPVLERQVKKWPLLADCHDIPSGIKGFDVRMHPNGRLVVVLYKGGQSEEER